jgi:UDP-galactopyranose mutase
MSRFDYAIVGAGFAGSVLAERLANDGGKKVLLIDRRPHVGGNAYDEHNSDGLLIHRYGPHIFHTNSAQVFAYLSRFTQWRPYEHRVLAGVDGRLLPIPINRTTINQLYGLSLSEDEVEAFLQTVAEKPAAVRTSEDAVVARVGRDLYEKLFRNYTRKQWGLDPSQLDACVTARIPVRTNDDDRYFSDAYQAMPLHGYTRMFENMLDSPSIRLELGTDFRSLPKYVKYDALIFTGPIDEYFGHCFGPLPYRSLRFEHRTVETSTFQPVAVVNYPNDHAYTRITEYKHLTGQEHDKTAITYEFPQNGGDPYYPIPRPENAALYERYKQLAQTHPHVRFVGRLGTYRYYNMDQVVAQALDTYAKIRGAASWTQVA